MNHRSVEKKLSHYLAGDLHPSLESKLEEHLQICPECEKRLQDLFEFEQSMISLFQTERSPENLPEAINLSLSPKEDHPFFKPLRRNRKTLVIQRPRRSLWKPLGALLFALVSLTALIFCFLWEGLKSPSKVQPRPTDQRIQKQKYQTEKAEPPLRAAKIQGSTEPEVGAPKRKIAPKNKNNTEGNLDQYKKLVRKSLQFGYAEKKGWKK